ncbi:MAG TPA: glycoside hydrolase family 19 protein [Archangium sp.]|uniref:glycoside hydrolase family 19 protein n=1 Tax=Archangium sp. TaxID=1872627 RepID=UPI002E31372E|nr:glycoside hydrolase family 19 protein [Archangium sp.]HEX5753111.1 glycoside hydrolase family 19 protein [Archangium sp.]
MDVNFPIEGVASEDPLFSGNETGPDGFFPVGTNGFWHGGVHLRTDKPLIAIRDGVLVAYRINKDPLVAEVEEAKMEYSSGFVLLRHEVQTPLGHKATFYSLLMHVLPWAAYRNNPALIPPRFLAERHPKKIKTDRDGRGVNVRSDASAATIVGVIPRGALVVPVPGAAPAGHWSTTREYRGFVKVRWNGLEGWAKIDRSNSREERATTQWIATALIPVWRADDSSQKLGDIPANAMFQASRESPSHASWSRHARKDALFRVAYGSIQGYADLKDSALAANLRLTGGDDAPADRAKLGLAVRERGDNDAPVLRILPKGELVRFKDPLAVKRPDRKFYELEAGGFIFVDDTTMELDWAIIEPEKFDDVVVPARPIEIERGTPLGYAGTFLREFEEAPAPPAPSTSNLVHFELFTTDPEFAKNPHNEHWFGTKFRLPPGTVFKLRQATPGALPPKVVVDLRVKDSLELVRQNQGSGHAQYFRYEVVGWKRISELGEYFGEGYTVLDPVDPLLESLPSCWCKEPEVTTVQSRASRGDYLEPLDTKKVDETYKHVRYQKLVGTRTTPVDGWAREHELGDFYAQAYCPAAAVPSAVSRKPSDWISPPAPTDAVELSIGRCVRHDAEQQVPEVFRKVRLNSESGWTPKALLGSLDPLKHVYKPASPVPFLPVVPTTREEMQRGRTVPAGSELEDAGEETTSNETWIQVTFRNASAVEATAWARKAELGPVLRNRFVLTRALEKLVAQRPNTDADTEKEGLRIDAAVGAALEYLGNASVAKREYKKVQRHETDIVGWKRSRELRKYVNPAPRHFRLADDLSSLLRAEPRQIELAAAAGAEVTVLQAATIAGTPYLQISHRGKSGWWPQAELGEVRAGRCTLASDRQWVLQDKPADRPDELKITARRGDAVFVEKQVGVFAKIRIVVTEDSERCHGWYATADFRGGSLNKTLTEVLTDDPDSAFTVNAGVNTAPIEFEATTEPPVRTQNGEGWHEVEYGPGKRGWINLHIDIADRRFVYSGVTATSAYDWEGWQKLQEEGAEAHFSNDGLCDVPTLINLLEKDERGAARDATARSGLPTPRAIQKALTDEKVKGKLRKLICQHPSEWDSGGDWERKFSRLKAGPWHLDEANYRATLDYIKKLEFWSAAFAGDRAAPAPARVWHWHPINVLAQWKRMRGITAEQLKRIIPRARNTDIARHIGWLNVTMERYEINTPLLQAHFLAQIGHESGAFFYSEEVASGERYEARFDLGNIRPEDGKKFKGRGLMQLTGRFNYSKYGAFIGEDLTANPSRVATEPRLVCDVAGWFWRYNDVRDLNTVATSADDVCVKKVTRVVNGGENGLSERQELFHNAKRVLMD